MNKKLKPFLFILIAAIIIGAMFLIGKIDDNTGGTVTSTTSTKSKIDISEYQSKCNLLGDNQWSPSAYSNLKIELETYTRQSNADVSREDIENITTYLEQKYAMSMLNTYDEWLIKKGETNISDVYNAMFKQSNLPGCKAILDTPIIVINKYQQIIGFPNRVSQFLSQEYNESQKINLENEIINLCSTNQIREFEIVNNIKFNAQKELYDFKTYFDAIDDYIIAYKRSSEYKNYLKSFCNNVYSNTSKYYYYDELIKKSGACK